MDVDELQNSLIKEWAGMCKLMQTFIPITFPYFTFQGFAKEIIASEETTKDGKTGGKTILMGQ